MTTGEARQDDAADGLRSPQPRALKLVWHGPFSPSGRTVPPSLLESSSAEEAPSTFPLHDVFHPGHEDARHVAQDAPKLAVRLERRVASRRALPRDVLQPGRDDAQVEKDNSVQSDVDWLDEVLHRPAQPGFHMIPIAPHLIRKLRRLSIDSRSSSPSAGDSRGPGGSRGPARSSKTRATVAAAAAKKLRAAASAIRRSVAILRDARLLERAASEGEAQTPERQRTAALPLRKASSSPERPPSSKELATAKKLRTAASGTVRNSAAILRDARLRQRSDSEGDAHTPERSKPRAARNSLIPSCASSPATLQRTPSFHHELPLRKTSSGLELPSEKIRPLRRAHSTLSRAISL